MIKYAKINSEDIVENILISDSESISSMEGNYVIVTSETNEPQIGFGYDSQKNKFMTEQPWPSWILNGDTLIWECPAGPKPTDGFYRWNEESLSWDPLS